MAADVVLVSDKRASWELVFEVLRCPVLGVTVCCCHSGLKLSYTLLTGAAVNAESGTDTVSITQEGV